MQLVDIIAVSIAVVKCILIYCITQAAIHFDCPWLLLIYLAVPVLSSPGIVMRHGKDK